MHERWTRARAVTAAGALALAAACTPMDDMLASVPFFAFMREAPSLDPWEAPRTMPPGSVPFSSPHGGEALPWLEPTVQALEAYAAGPYGVNPLPAGDSAVLATGRAMYDRYCFVCHGTAGTGDGPVVGPEKFPALVTNLILPLSVGRSDGYIYAVVRAGRGLMPPYGQRMTERERWAVVHYVRELQRQGGAPPAAAAPDPAAAAPDTGAAAAPDTAQGAED